MYTACRTALEPALATTALCAGRIYRENIVATKLPGVAAVMAAGNHFAVVVRDILHQLFVNHNLCVVKMNSCSDWWGAHLETVLAPFVKRGALRSVYGGVETAQVRMPLILAGSMQHCMTACCSCERMRRIQERNLCRSYNCFPRVSYHS
jgi:hypothetical protein